MEVNLNGGVPMAGHAILAYVPDLMFAVHLREAAAKSQNTVSIVETRGDFETRLPEVHPALAVLDLTASGSATAALVTLAGQYDCRVIAYGPHVQKTLLAQAREAGCVAVYAKSVFKMETAKILRKWLGDMG